LNLNNVEICSLRGLEPQATPSNLTVVASSTTDSPFLFDQIEYAPPYIIDLPDNATIVVDAFDDTIDYSSGWTTAGKFGLETSVQNSSLNYKFDGIQITWMTVLALNPPNITINASAQYSIDDGGPVPFPVVAQNPDQIYNLVSFQTGLLSPGTHELFVEYGVDNFVEGSAPLVLDYFIIQKQTPPSVASSPGISQGAIAGAVVGSVLSLALIIFCLWWCNRREKAASSLGREYKPDAAYGDLVHSDGSESRLEREKMAAARNYFEKG